MIHSIWGFLSERTICGQPLEREQRPGSPWPHDYIVKNIALELRQITCPECRAKKEATHAA